MASGFQSVKRGEKRVTERQLCKPDQRTHSVSLHTALAALAQDTAQGVTRTPA